MAIRTGGFFGDHKEDEHGNVLSTPDGNAAYGGYLISAMQRAGHEVIMMQEDRDWPATMRRGRNNFQAFSEDLRFQAYKGMKRTNPTLAEKYKVFDAFPQLDVLFLEWRFPIPGRNTPDMKGKPGYQPDLDRQNALIKHYSETGTKIIVWDMDHKVIRGEEAALFVLGVQGIIETAVTPRRVILPRYRVEPPVAVQDLLQRPSIPSDPNRKLVYVGSRYERDDVIEEWIKPVSDRFPQQVEFWGNWTAEKNFAEVRAKWPNIRYMDRITMKDFPMAYGTAVACPLLAKKSYLEVGFITPRIWEAIIFGTVPVGLSHHRGIEQYLPPELIARDPGHLGDIVARLAEASDRERALLREDVAKRLEFMDASNFVRVIEGVTNG